MYSKSKITFISLDQVKVEFEECMEFEMLVANIALCPLINKWKSIVPAFADRSEHDFDKAMRFYEHNQLISGKTFTLPHFRAVWQLDAYPRGRNGYTDVHGYPWFSLRLIGFQTPDGSLSADKTKSIKADYKICVRSSANEERKLVQQLSQFNVDAIRFGASISSEEIKKFIHPDGSLLLICEIESLASEKTFSLEPSPNPALLDQNLQLTDHIGKMWKSQLFTDCILKVGAKSFPAHKCILSQWSEVFQKIFSLPTEEAESGVVEIEDFKPDAISAMLEYMYTGVVKKEVMEKLALELLALSDKYGVLPLKEMCEVYIASKLTATDVLLIVILAERYSAAKLKKACVNRLAIDGRAALQSQKWADLKSKNKDLADELLELLIKDHPCFADDQEIKVANLPLRVAVTWRLDVYPHGNNEHSDNPYFSLRLIGFQTSKGRLSADTKSINADYKIYLLSSTNEESIVRQGLSEFNTEPIEHRLFDELIARDSVGSSMTAEEAKKFIDPDGSLLVICEIECLAPKKTISMEQTSILQLTDHIGKMWKSQLFTDCTLKVGSKSFPAHKCILGQWSEVFRKMFSPPTKEAESGVVEITDFSPDAISAMLEYMYTGLVNNKVMEKYALELLALSDKYAVISLKEVCEVFLASRLTTKNFLQIMFLADRHSAAKLKQACVDRLVMHGRAALQSKEWEELKSQNKELATELLELMVKDHPGCVDVQAKPEKIFNKQNHKLKSMASNEDTLRIRVYKVWTDHSISSKTFILPHLKAVWQLDVYPCGKGGIIRPYFYLRLIGFQAPDGSLSENKDKSIMADHKLYFLDSANEKGMMSQGVSEFKVGSVAGSYDYNNIINKFIHSDGSLLLVCEVASLSPGETFSTEPTSNLQLTDHIGKMWKSQLFSDCTIKVGAKSFPAHKCILGQWSEVFQKIFSLPLEEAESGVVEIEDFKPDVIDATLEYMYTGLVKTEVMEKLALELLVLADKYAVIPLKEMCEVFLSSKLTAANVLEFVTLADLHLAAKLKKACVNRLAIDGRAALQSKEWEDLKNKNKDLADELLELLIKDRATKS
ncbi:BTB/POZ domain-containing protein [Ditylenchus destructor]|uniref:BTB/POZ domain-containing protein n=1 Tax=Ditylenchus destructor TaxID=166010 RepID=A0AAD4MT75_9BILA|nr:BTB/POZ domain-containing protein [Ditylenchus destructor]